MFHSLSSLFRSHRRAASDHRRDRRARLALEELENRFVPAPTMWMVGTTMDTGQGNLQNHEGDLRWCMNNAASGDIINFAVSGTISPNSQLPTIRKNLTIDGAGQSVTIKGRDANSAYCIFNIASNWTNYNVEIDNLTITGGGSMEGAG